MIDKQLIILDCEIKSKEDIMFLLSKRAKQLHYICNDIEYLSAVKKREKEYSTAIGYGVAIPHGKTWAVEKSFIGFIRCKEPIKWGAEKVSLIFQLGISTKNTEALHLKVLAEISRNLMKQKFREHLLKGSKQEVYQKLLEIEQNVRIAMKGD